MAACSSGIVRGSRGQPPRVPVARGCQSIKNGLWVPKRIRQSLSDNAIRTLIHSFVITRIDYCNSVLSCITAVPKYQTSSENFECSSSSRTSNSKVCSSINADQRQSALAPSSATNQIQDPAAGCKLFTSESTSVSSGTLCAGFGATGASTFVIRRPILSGGQSLSIIIDAEAGIRCGRTVGVE